MFGNKIDRKYNWIKQYSKIQINSFRVFGLWGGGTLRDLDSWHQGEIHILQATQREAKRYKIELFELNKYKIKWEIREMTFKKLHTILTLQYLRPYKWTVEKRSSSVTPAARMCELIQVYICMNNKYNIHNNILSYIVLYIIYVQCI